VTRAAVEIVVQLNERHLGHLSKPSRVDLVLKKKTPHTGGAGYRRSNELLGGRISIRGQGRIGMDGRPAFFREASDICDQSV